MPHIFSLLAGVFGVDTQSDVASHPNGTGPFRLASLTPGIEIRLVRNTSYWQPDLPRLDAVSLRTVPDVASAVLALETGAVGIAQCGPLDAARLSSGGGTRVVALQGSGAYDIAINAAAPPFSDRRVRQAIDHALNRRRFAQTLMRGLTEPTQTIWTRQSPAWEASLERDEFDLERSRALLIEAGYAGGFETTLQASRAYPELVRFDEIVQADLAGIGVRVGIELLDANEALALVTRGTFPALINHVYSYGDQDPAMQFTAFVLRPDGNASRFVSAEYASVVEQARGESDWSRRLSAYRSIAQFVKHEAFLLPIAQSVNIWGARDNVQGLVRQPLVADPVLAELSVV